MFKYHVSVCAVSRILPLAIKIGMAIVIVAYLAANVAYMSLLSTIKLMESHAIAKAGTQLYTSS